MKSKLVYTTTETKYDGCEKLHYHSPWQTKLVLCFGDWTGKKTTYARL